MGGLFDIAASGIQAYRSALGVTGQNIANINTDGYRRREAALVEITATQSSVLTKADQTGLGVRVGDIRRSFDVFLAARTRDTAADHASAEAYLAAMQELERAFLPGGQDIAAFMNDFFSGLASIGQAPGDLAPRVAVLEQGRTMAAAFAETAGTLEALRGALVGQAQQSVAEFNALLDNLARTQARVLSAGQSGAASNAVLDERDRLIGEMTQIAGLSVGYQPRQDVVLRLGTAGGGPVLLQGFDASPLGLREIDGRLTVLTGAGRTQSETLQATTGRLAGLIEAHQALGDAAAALDQMARAVAGGLNAVHAGGLTLDGARGGAMLTTDAARLRAAPENLGRITTSLRAPDILPDDPGSLDFYFDARAGLWRGLDAQGREVASGATRIRHGAIEIEITGTPADGDLVQLITSTGKAGNMRFLLDRPQAFAAAALALASADPANRSSARVEIAPQGMPEAPAMPRLGDLVANDGSALSAARFRQDGAVAIIPAGTRAVDLFSLSAQASVGFSLTPTQVQQLAATRLELTVGGDGVAFELADVQAPNGADRPVVLADLAFWLNAGAIVADGNARRSFADLGLHAAADGGQLTISSRSGDITGALVGAGFAGGRQQGASRPANPVASEIQIFTREGRHIAGSPMPASEIARLISAENGFFGHAEYRADTLNAPGGVGYLGMQLARSAPAGAQVLRLPAAQLAAGGALALDLLGDTFAVPDPGAGASARRVATALNAHASDSGIHASALTRIELRDPSAEGPISLTLRAGARDALVIDANLTPGNLAGLRDAINARAADIGITASLTPDGARIVLQQAEGETIHLDALGSRDRPPQAISLTVRAVDDRYLPVAGSETTFGTAQAPVSMAGIVRIEAARPFALTRLGQTQTSASDPFADGLLRREIGQAGRTQTIAFGIVEGIDTAEAAPDGSAASSAAASYAITIGALSATVDSAHLAAPTTGAVAAALGLALRTRAPVPLLTTTLDPLPPEGAELRVALGGQTFRIAMRDGVPVVDGPEAGRLAVSLTSDRVLTISASDGEISGQGVQVTGGAVAAFGFDPAGGAIGKIVGRPVGDVAGSFAVQIGAQTHLLAVASDGQATGAPQGLTVTREAGRLVLTLGTGLTGEAVRILPSDGAAALGLVVAEATLRVDAQGMHFEALNNEALQISGSAQSLAAQRLTLSGLPEEDLIVVLTGAGGARQIALRHDTAPPLGLPAMPVPLELRVIDAATRRVEVIDRATGHSIATRTLPDDGVVTAAGYRFEVRGAVATGDRFLLDPNIGATGDGRNIEALIALQARGQTGDAGGFQDIYRALVTEVGARVRSGGMAVASALALRDAAAEIESRMAGVNLDTEAARLLEQQQAYQALSRVLRSAGELLDTLLQSI